MFILLVCSVGVVANEISQQFSVQVKQIEYLLEGGGRYDFSKVKAVDSTRWQTVERYPLNLVGVEQGVWGRFKLVNVEQVPLQRILEFANPQLHRLSIYIESSLGRKYEWSLGNYFAFKEREILFRNYAVPLKLQANEELVVYFRAETHVGLLLPISVHKESEFWRLANNENLAYGLFFGVLLMFVAFNAVLYFFHNETIYILFAIDLFVFSLMYANHLGLNFEYFWPVDPQFNYLASLFLGYLLVLTANVFTWHFLQIKDSNYLQKFYYFINAFTLLMTALLWSLPIKISSFICAFLGVFISFYLAWLSTKNRDRDEDHAYLYIASYGLAAVATGIYISHKLALLPTNVITSSALGVGVLLQSIVLTMVLIERKKRVEQTIGFQSSLQAESTSEKHWLAQFSHEVRTPLNGIIGMVDLLRETPLNPTQYGYVRTLSSSGKYLLDLVEDELSYDNLSRGALKLHEAPFNLDVLCQQCCKMLEQQASCNQVVIETDFTRLGQFDFYGDEKCLKQIIINLLSNSIKFAKQGRVVISAEYSNTNHLTLSVWDNGIGIAQDQQPRVFERFCQLGSDAYSRSGGSGLGLAICQQLSKLMGGHIAVASRVGEYCCFTVEIPLALYKKPSEPLMRRSANKPDDVYAQDFLIESAVILSSRELVVLGVDDNEINRRVLGAMLKKLGHKLIEASSGQQAIDVVRSGASLDLILMDCEMPQMSGFEATKTIRQFQYGQAGAPCPIVALTAHTFSEHVEQCLAAGMDAHLSKPLRLEELKALLESLELKTRSY